LGVRQQVREIHIGCAKVLKKKHNSQGYIEVSGATCKNWMTLNLFHNEAG